MRRFIVLAVSLAILVSVISCRKEENEMTDINKIMKEIPSEYKKQKKVNGVLRDTCFFKDFIGYDHPVQMHGPLSYAETQNREFGYLEASIDTSGKIPLLIFVESFFPRRNHIALDEKQLNKEKKGDVYYLFHKYNDHIVLDKEVTLNDTFDVKEYVHVVFDKAGKPTISELIKKEFEWSYLYEYDDNGLLTKVIGRAFDYDGAVVQERGKDF